MLLSHSFPMVPQRRNELFVVTELFWPLCIWISCFVTFRLGCSEVTLVLIQRVCTRLMRNSGTVKYRSRRVWSWTGRSEQLIRAHPLFRISIFYDYEEMNDSVLVVESSGVMPCQYYCHIGCGFSKQMNIVCSIYSVLVYLFLAQEPFYCLQCVRLTSHKICRSDKFSYVRYPIRKAARAKRLAINRNVHVPVVDK
jgi:hypothetical protein